MRRLRFIVFVISLPCVALLAAQDGGIDAQRLWDVRVMSPVPERDQICSPESKFAAQTHRRGLQMAQPDRDATRPEITPSFNPRGRSAWHYIVIET